jgi:UDP-glucose 4-epimerase
MQEGKHMGKIVVQVPEEAARLPTSKVRAKISFCGDGAYLLVGGLGGLGRAVAQWMVEHGAKYLVFLSRSAGTTARDGEFLDDLMLQGCHGLLVQGDVANLADVQRAVAASCRPIKGVMHMAMAMQVNSNPEIPSIGRSKA